MPHGQGTLTEGESCVIEGNFDYGQIKSGTMFYVNGDRYEGEFENEKPHGQGSLK